MVVRVVPWFVKERQYTSKFEDLLTGFTDNQALTLCSWHQRDTGRSGTAVDLDWNGCAWTSEDSHEPFPR